MKISNHLKSKKGSSSILVILFVITLVVFGTLAMMSAYSDFKLAKKNAEWTRSYYKLDAQGEVMLQKIDGCLKSALDETVISAKPDENSKNQFFSVATKKLNALSEAKMLKIKNINGDLTINTKIAFTSENSKQYLDIGLLVLYPQNSNDTGPRFQIQKWILTPTTFEYNNNNIELWDGGINTQ